MCTYSKTQISLHDPTKLAIHSILRPEDDLKYNCGQNFKQTVFSSDFIHEKIIMTFVDFDCGITFYPETPTKIRQIN